MVKSIGSVWFVHYIEVSYSLVGTLLDVPLFVCIILVIQIRSEGPCACVAGLPVVGWFLWTFNCMCKSLWSVSCESGDKYRDV